MASYSGGHSTVSSQSLHMLVPITADYEQVAKRFENIWKFPNCIVALVDCKHYRIKHPQHSGTMYFNYKKTLSVVLLIRGLLMTITCFRCWRLWKTKRWWDLKGVRFGKVFLNKTICVYYRKKCFLEINIKVPHVFIGYEAFLLHGNVMKPFPSKWLENSKK